MDIAVLLRKVKTAGNYQTVYERRLRSYCSGYPGSHLKNPDRDTSLKNIWQTLSFWVTASRLTVLESLDLTDFKSVFGCLVRCLVPVSKCLDPDSSNVRRGSQNSISLIDAHTLSGSFRQFSLHAKERQFLYLSKKVWISKFRHQIKELEDFSYS